MKIRIFYDDIGYRFNGWRNAVQLFKKVIGSEKRIPGDLNFILTTDQSLKKINLEFLKHNYFTDVITFNSNEGNVISGEVYISLETVKLNASDYNTNLNNELLRVMIHGVLHLCGYNDTTAKEKKFMRQMEDRWLME